MEILMARNALTERPDLDVPAPAEAVGDADTQARNEGAARFKAMEAVFRKQPRFKVRLPEDAIVVVNGYPFQIKGKTTVEVPQSVYEIIEQAQENGRF